MNISRTGYSFLNNTWLTLMLTYGLVYIIAGIDKLLYPFMKFYLIVDWTKYISPYAITIIPTSHMHQFMLFVGILEIILGLCTLIYPRAGAYLIGLWLLIIAINLTSMGLFDIAIRDVVMAVGAFALAWLTTAREEVYEH